MAEERRLVTILFADVVGSTTLGDSLDPEDLRALLARYYGLARDVISARGGTVEKFIGDAVMAVFGLPAAHDDDPSRALDAAIALRDAVKADAMLGDRMPIRIGVNTGEVVASVDLSAGDFLVTGDAVNVAARLQQTADPWEIVCSDRTAHAATAFSMSEAFALEARGKAAPVLARRVLGPSPARQPVYGPRTPLIGRDADLAQLELVSKRAFAERRPYLVSIIAPPGAGKSRLLEAFLDRLPDLAPAARAAVAQCLPYGQRLTFWPLRSLLEALAGVNFDIAPERIRESIASWLHDLGDDAAERTADQLAATLGATELEIVDRYEVFGAWRHAIEVAAEHGPIVLAVEDLHWSSESLLDMIEFIFQPRPDVPMLMLALSRPEFLDRRPGWGGGRRNYVSLSLEPLGDDDIGQLVASLLEDPALEVVAAVVDRADGNPFYAGEMVRSLIEHQANLHAPEAVAETLAKLPDTVQGTVLARLDLLPPAPRRVLQLGSILGRSFDHTGLGVLEPGLDASLSEVTDLLVDREMIVPGPARSWTFRHILIREVAYQTLPRADRARLHAAAGRYLEGLPGEPEERAELVAFHFREAANLSAVIGEGTHELRSSAVEWLQRAAEAAFRGGATVEATRHLRAAIELVKQEDQPELYRRLGELSVDATTRGELPDLYRRLGEVSWGGNLSADAFRDAYTVGRELGRPPAFLLQMLAEELMVLTRWHASVAHQPSETDLSTIRDEGNRLLGIVEDERARASFLIAQGFVPFWIRSNGQRQPTAAEIAETEASARAGLALAEKLEDPRLISAALDASSSLVFEDEPARAREIQRRRWQYADRLSILERTDAFQMVAWQSAVLGEAENALRAAEAGLATIEGRQAPETVLTLVAWKTWALAMQGRWNEVPTVVGEQRQMWYDGNRPAAGYALQGPLAASYVASARGDELLLDMCREQVDEICEQFAQDHPVKDLAAIASLDLDTVADRIVGAFERYIERLHHVALGIAVTADRAHPLPADALDRLIEHAGKRGMRWIEAEARRARGLASGNLRELERARALLDGTGMAPRVARMEADVGLMTGDEGRFQAALRQLEALGDVDSGTRLAAARRERRAAGA